MKNRNMPIVPIVLAANDDYMMPCCTAVSSIMKHVSEGNIYRIYILETEMSGKNKELLEELKMENFTVECLNISDLTQNLQFEGCGHLSKEALYRLLIPRIFIQYEKVIWLDCDLCVLADVAELYMLEMGKYPIGAVPVVPTYGLKAHAVRIGYDSDWRKMFCSGVLIINTVQFEKEKIFEKCYDLLKEDNQKEDKCYLCQDQDVLNLILRDNYYEIDLKWDYQTGALENISGVIEEMRESYIKEGDNAYIVHFTGSAKPWKYPELPKAEVFWKCFKEMPEEVVAQNIQIMERKLLYYEIFCFPYSKIPYGSRLVIYGAGMVGKSFYYQMKGSAYADIVLWVDREYEKMDKIFDIRAADEIVNSEYDYIVIAIEKESIAIEIKNTLMSMSIPADKLIWDEYRN